MGDDFKAYKLITYIIATNRLMLRKLEGKYKIPNFAPEFQQFIVTNLNPEFERKFEISKKKVFLQDWFNFFSMGQYFYSMEAAQKIGILL